MTSEKRGLCIIINNEHFMAESKFNRRNAAARDAANLYTIFVNLGFVVQLYCDQTAEMAVRIVAEGL